MEARPMGAKAEYIQWIGEEKAQLLEKLDKWPLSFVEEKLIENGHSTPENVKDHILWYKQFMSFKILRPEVRCGMFSDIVDEVWHWHILFTQDYAKFGEELFGGFIHHIPCNIMDLSIEAQKEYQEWLTDYEEIYGHLPEDLAQELKEQESTKSPACTNHSHANPNLWKCNR